MKQFEQPAVKITMFDPSDILTASGELITPELPGDDFE